jgi:zinc transporter 1
MFSDLKREHRLILVISISASFFLAEIAGKVLMSACPAAAWLMKYQSDFILAPWPWSQTHSTMLVVYSDDVEVILIYLQLNDLVGFIVALVALKVAELLPV